MIPETFTKKNTISIFKVAPMDLEAPKISNVIAPPNFKNKLPPLNNLSHNNLNSNDNQNINTLNAPLPGNGHRRRESIKQSGLIIPEDEKGIKLLYYYIYFSIRRRKEEKINRPRITNF